MSPNARRSSGPDSNANFEIERIDRSLVAIQRSVEHIQDQAEQRVRLFLTIASAGVALMALTFQFGKLQSEQQTLAAIAVLTILLLYGVETLHSLNWMVLYVRESTGIARHLGKMLESYSSVDRTTNAILNDAEQLKSRSWYRRTVRGSLPEFMYLTNALLCTGISYAVALVLCLTVCSAIYVLIGIFVIALTMQYWYSRWMRNTIPLEWVRKHGQPA